MAFTVMDQTQCFQKVHLLCPEYFILPPTQLHVPAVTFSDAVGWKLSQHAQSTGKRSFFLTKSPEV